MIPIYVGDYTKDSDHEAARKEA